MDEDDDVPEWDGGDLGRFFGGKTFYIKSDVENEEDRNTLVKYIVAHCGLVKSRQSLFALLCAVWRYINEVTYMGLAIHYIQNKR